jgi:hypothetical protein
MNEQSRKWLPDCPAKAEATISDRWSKKAKSTRRKDPITGLKTGPYSVWRLQEEVAKSARMFVDLPTDQQITELRKLNWPRFSIRKHFGLAL